MPHSPALVLPDAELDIHRDRRRAIAVYVGGVLLLLVVIASLMFDQYRRDTRIAQERTVARADLVAEWVTSTFAASEALLASVATRIEGNEAPGELGDWLAALGDELPFSNKTVVLESKGGSWPRPAEPIHRAMPWAGCPITVTCFRRRRANASSRRCSGRTSSRSSEWCMP